MKTIVGLYEDTSTANQVVQALVNDGIGRDQISLVASHYTDGYATAVDDIDSSVAEPGSATAGGAVTGAVIGGVGGALLSLGALAIPGIGPVVAAGPLIAGLVGAGTGAAVGGLLGALTELGVPEEEAGYYIEGIHRGGTLISVQTDDDETDQVVDIMNRYHPIDVKERAATWRDETKPDYGDSVNRPVSEDAYASTETLAGQIPAERYTRDTLINQPTSTPDWRAFNGGDYNAADYQSHYQSNYSNSGHTYADYDPAYRYGYTLARDNRYTGRDWDAIEADAQREWTQNYKGSAWEEFKDAVRYGWERTKQAVTS